MGLYDNIDYAMDPSYEYAFRDFYQEHINRDPNANDDGPLEPLPPGASPT